MTSPVIKVPTALQDGLGKTVAELIKDDVRIAKDGSVTGTLLKVKGYTGFSDVSGEQEGHYLPIVLDSRYKSKTISCQRNSDTPKTASDLEWVLRVPSTATTFTFKADGEAILTLNFRGAVLE